MGSRRRGYHPLRMKVTKDGIEMQGRSVKDMKVLTLLTQNVQKPHATSVGRSGVRTQGYWDHGESNALLWGLGTLSVIGLGALGLWAYKKIGKDSEPLQTLPASASDSVVDAHYEEVVVPPQPTESQEPPKPKTRSEKFLEEFGPLPELPPILQFVVERSPAGYEVAMTVTLLCAFAALCFSKVRAKYLDGKIHAPNLLVLVEADWGVGKEKFMTALNALFKLLFDRDKAKYSSDDEGKIIQWAGISATESKFIAILANNGEVHVLMVSSEVLAAVNNMRKQNGLTAEYFRKAFDNGEVYRANKSKAIQGLFRVFMNCILTGTPGDTDKFFSKELEGGTASRFCLLDIPDSGRYLKALIIEDGEELESYRNQIEEWNRLYCYNHDELSGCDIPAEEHFIELDYVNAAIETWINDDQWYKANGDTSDPRVGARGRMGAIAFHCAMVIHMLFGCPDPNMLQTRRKVVDLTIYIANYCMERFLLKFGAIQKVQRELNNQAETIDLDSSPNAQQSSSQSDEGDYSGGLSKATVKKMAAMHVPGVVGYGAIAKAFGLSGDTGKKTVQRAISKYRQEQSKQ